MESYNQSVNESFSLDDTSTEEVPLFVTYLNMVIVLMVTVIVITPAVMVINIICKTKELHTKYYFFIANLLATDIINVIVEGVLQYGIMIIYLLGLNSKPVSDLLKQFILPIHTTLRFMSILSLITLAVERVIMINSPRRHRYIMSKKTMAGILAAAWGLSAILMATITLVIPVDIIWPLAVIDFHDTAIPFFVFAHLTSAAFIVAANVYLLYKVSQSSRKVEENERLGNEEEARRFRKLTQMFQLQSKTTITLLVVGGINIIANILIPVLYMVFSAPVDEPTEYYLQQFIMYPIQSSLFLSHSLTYVICVKNIQRQLPNFKICQILWPIRCSRVTKYTVTTTILYN